MDRIRKAALRFYQVLDRFEIIEEDFEGFIVVKDSDISFVNVVQIADSDSYDAGMITRSEFEEVLDKYIKSHDDVDIFFKFDIMQIHVIKQDRALVKLIRDVQPKEDLYVNIR